MDALRELHTAAGGGDPDTTWRLARLPPGLPPPGTDLHYGFDFVAE
ncbi:hypothetical protein AB0I28_20900 [Phytomonospora sp. NPDC050363]